MLPFHGQPLNQLKMTLNRKKIVECASNDSHDAFSREVHGIFGIPVDVDDSAEALRKIENAATIGATFLLSTSNLNFLTSSRIDPEFRKSLLISDLCTADGMPIVWLARLLGVQIAERVAGSDLYAALKSKRDRAKPLSVYFFGGPEGIAARACKILNAENAGLTCVGSFSPGFGSVDDMSTDGIINKLNATKADILIVALGAKKGQSWLLRNHKQIRIPIRVHLGAAINFQAGSVKRAPVLLQKYGLEWLWRIKEEPSLWSRYGRDGLVLLELMITRVAPLIILRRWKQLRGNGTNSGLTIRRSEDHKSVTLWLTGAGLAQNVGNAVPYFRAVVSAEKDVVVNCTELNFIDTRFLGLLLMLNKELMRRRRQLQFTGVSPSLARLFRLNEFAFLLNT
jgi:N-acetylglucosaminyldiphosphoundecaprenol N-acetyl-beta-D-mannosaminyltransferase